MNPNRRLEIDRAQQAWQRSMRDLTTSQRMPRRAAFYPQKDLYSAELSGVTIGAPDTRIADRVRDATAAAAPFVAAAPLAPLAGILGATPLAAKAATATANTARTVAPILNNFALANKNQIIGSVVGQGVGTALAQTLPQEQQQEQQPNTELPQIDYNTALNVYRDFQNQERVIQDSRGSVWDTGANLLGTTAALAGTAIAGRYLGRGALQLGNRKLGQVFANRAINKAAAGADTRINPDLVRATSRFLKNHRGEFNKLPPDIRANFPVSVKTHLENLRQAGGTLKIDKNFAQQFFKQNIPKEAAKQTK